MAKVKRGNGKTAKGIKHQSMTQKLAKKKAGEQRFSNGKVGIRSTPSNAKVVRSGPTSRPRVSTLERPGKSSRNKRYRQTFHVSEASTITSTGVDRVKLRQKAAQGLKRTGVSTNGDVSEEFTDGERNHDTGSENTTRTPRSPRRERMRELRSAFATSATRSFGSNFSEFDPIAAIRSKMSNVEGRLRGLDIDDDDEDVQSEDNSLRERYSLPEPVFSPSQLRSPKPQPLPSAKIKVPSSSRRRARECAVFDAMSGDESRDSRDVEAPRQQGGRFFFADATIPVLSEDASSDFDTVYTAQSAMENGRLGALPLSHKQESVDAPAIFNPSKGEKQASGGRCRCPD